MKRIRNLHLPFIVILICCAANAQTTVSDLVGDWTRSSIFYPGAPVEDPLVPGLSLPVGGLPAHQELGMLESWVGTELMSVTVNANSTYSATLLESSEGETGTFTGAVSISSEGDLEVDVGESEPIALSPNAGKSLMVMTDRESYSTQSGTEYSINLDVVTRDPASLVLSELAGEWTYQGSYLSGLFNSYDFDTPIPVTVDAVGGVTATVPGEGTLSFSLSYLGEGRVTLEIDEGVESYQINSAKDVMVRLSRMEDDFSPEDIPRQWGGVETAYEYSTAFIVKKPETLAMSELAGVWTVYNLLADVEFYSTDPFNNPPSPDFEPFGEFEWMGQEKIRLIVEEVTTTESTTDGLFEATLVEPSRDDVEETGETIRGEVNIVDEELRITFNDEGVARRFTFAVNSSKDFFVGYQAEAAMGRNTELAYDLIVGVRKDPADLGIFETVEGAVELQWVNLPWLGRVFLLGTGTSFLYHEEHGWILIKGTNLDGFWIFFPGLEKPGGGTGLRLWTSESLYPTFLRENPDVTEGPLAGYSFVSYDREYYEETGELWFYDFATGGEAGWLEEIPITNGP